MDDSKKNDNATTYMLCILALGITPILILFFCYLKKPDAYFFHTILIYTDFLPEITSSKNTTISKIISLYIKTAPFIAFISFLKIYKNISIRKDNSTIKLLTNLTLYIFFYIITIYLFLFCSHELTTSGKLLRVMSQNDYFLLLFFISLYASIYILSFMLLWFLVGSYKLIKERI
ncbi:TPA: colicin immunity protein Cui [Salmonella enterica subsp. enterica serovar Birkenhead]|nr:colicin immunity protein Cui [Salmonella enterica subsp. enterica serovar Birkenhead]